MLLNPGRLALTSSSQEKNELVSPPALRNIIHQLSGLPFSQLVKLKQVWPIEF